MDSDSDCEDVQRLVAKKPRPSEQLDIPSEQMDIPSGSASPPCLDDRKKAENRSKPDVRRKAEERRKAEDKRTAEDTRNPEERRKAALVALKARREEKKRKDEGKNEKSKTVNAKEVHSAANNCSSSNSDDGRPPKPELKLNILERGIGIEWNLTLTDKHARIEKYELFTYKEETVMPVESLWKKVGDIPALSLSMACILNPFAAKVGAKYFVTIRAVDVHKRVGRFSDPCIVHIQ